MKKRRKIKIRQAWKINPVTRVKVDEKKYDRKKAKRELRKILRHF